MSAGGCDHVRQAVAMVSPGTHPEGMGIDSTEAGPAIVTTSRVGRAGLHIRQHGAGKTTSSLGGLGERSSRRRFGKEQGPDILEHQLPPTAVKHAHVQPGRELKDQ